MLTVYPAGGLIGQAMTIHEWQFDDGTKGGPIADAEAAEQRQTAAATKTHAELGQ